MCSPRSHIHTLCLSHTLFKSQWQLLTARRVWTLISWTSSSLHASEIRNAPIHGLPLDQWVWADRPLTVLSASFGQKWNKIGRNMRIDSRACGLLSQEEAESRAALLAYRSKMLEQMLFCWKPAKKKRLFLILNVSFFIIKMLMYPVPPHFHQFCFQFIIQKVVQDMENMRNT